jgi:hypothetical protein
MIKKSEFAEKYHEWKEYSEGIIEKLKADQPVEVDMNHLQAEHLNHDLRDELRRLYRRLKEMESDKGEIIDKETNRVIACIMAYAESVGIDPEIILNWIY